MTIGNLILSVHPSSDSRVQDERVYLFDVVRGEYMGAVGFCRYDQRGNHGKLSFSFDNNCSILRASILRLQMPELYQSVLQGTATPEVIRKALGKQNGRLHPSIPLTAVVGGSA